MADGMTCAVADRGVSTGLALYGNCIEDTVRKKGEADALSSGVAAELMVSRGVNFEVAAERMEETDSDYEADLREARRRSKVSGASMETGAGSSSSSSGISSAPM